MKAQGAEVSRGSDSELYSALSPDFNTPLGRRLVAPPTDAKPRRERGQDPFSSSTMAAGPVTRVTGVTGGHPRDRSEDKTGSHDETPDQKMRKQ